MIDAINHLKMAADDYRRLTTPNQFTITETAARENERLANQFDLAAEALRQMHNRLFEDGIVAGVKSLVDSCNARRQRKDIPANAPEVTSLLGRWERRAQEALPADAMLINRHIRELRESIAAAPTPPVSEDRKDAERYRWLLPRLVAWQNKDFENAFLHHTHETIEEAIDAAMQEDKP